MSLTPLRTVFGLTLVLFCMWIAPASGLIQRTISEDQKSESTDQDSEDSETTKPKSPRKSTFQPKEETPEERRKRLRDRAQNSMGSVTNLIAIPQIQKELELTEQQRKQIADQVKSMQLYLRMQFRDVQKLPRSEQAQRIRELKMQTTGPMTERKQEILALLTEEQRMRLTGISMQYRGVNCLLDDKIADLLNLTEEQREELIVIAEQADQTMTAERLKLYESKPEDRRKIRQAFNQKQKSLRKSAEEKMLAVLTNEQRQKFEELQGKEFRAKTPKRPTPLRPVEDSEKDE